MGKKSIRYITIYMEGGGDGSQSRRELTKGMNSFLRNLKDKAENNGLKWRLVCCGGRSIAYDKFLYAASNDENFISILLVDSEEEVRAGRTAYDHLGLRDGWNLSSIGGSVHLMIQTMETWIVADPDALQTYYGQGFKRSALPRNTDLEAVGKAQISSALEKATRDTSKGSYKKISHASDLLAKIDRETVRRKCPACERMFDCLERAIEAA